MIVARTEEQRRAFELINSKAATEPEFRARLLRDPHAALSAAGIRISDAARIKFIEKDPGLDALIVLPDLVSDALNEEQMDVVSGGFRIGPIEITIDIDVSAKLV